MENILVLGSSLAKQVVQHNDRNGRKIDNILFKGKINLKSIESTLRDKNKQYKKVVYLSGNDLLPSKLHKVNNKTHVCQSWMKVSVQISILVWWKFFRCTQKT